MGIARVAYSALLESLGGGFSTSFPIKSQSSKSQSEDAGSTFPLFPASSLGTKYSYHHIVLDLDLSQDNINHTLSLSP
jgi:hypothetical protein